MLCQQEWSLYPYSIDRHSLRKGMNGFLFPILVGSLLSVLRGSVILLSLFLGSFCSKFIASILCLFDIWLKLFHILNKEISCCFSTILVHSLLDCSDPLFCNSITFSEWADLYWVNAIGKNGRSSKIILHLFWICLTSVLSLFYWSFKFSYCFWITICILAILLMIRYLWNRQGLGSCSCYIINASVKYLSWYLPQNICKLSPQFTVQFCRV